MITLEEMVIRKLKTIQHVFGTVESCTGGLLSHLFTNVPGVSEIYWGSLVTYDNSAKEELGVSEAMLLKHGAVSPLVAQTMAEGGLKKIQRSISRSPSQSLIKPRGFLCISTTGIAGPAGGSATKPVGLCYIGLAISGKTTLVDEFLTDSELPRAEIKMQFAQRALDLVRGTV